ncbi:Glycolipid anchored surface protein GAS1 [Neofusicoccum parvum]|uniref:1,3-beta-glucanosyltransferase n=2 Tax=Neofusicoccum parvum TaxID=310453 RepID=R1EL29_BOTPV|nr:putative -beta-glucanosyltransferase gel2 protein [Neofusicoccum parvum UCRNP2]GME24452.1 Glycolipid anchored surface protein GAS1 [Neofusicoccum parvum]GME61974.1 Glycolipid anchored surface protein GAS1 [Neofusicoccum parvum]
MLSKYLLASLVASTAVAVNPIEINGQDFVDTKTNKRFYVIGVDYQPGGQAGYDEGSGKDPLTDADACLRDAAIMQQLGVNTIRVYNVDPDGDHDTCASIFNYVGIYMMLDVNSPLAGESIDRSNPSSSYHEGYLERVFKMVEAFKNYPNTLAFFGANEIINDIPSSEDNPPYIRAVQRDLKQYIKNNADRTIPVGYSAAQVQEVLEDTWEYLQCAIDGDQDDMSRSDFFGLNSYSWCGGDATYTSSGYSDLVDMFKNSSIPVFFSEYGCNEVQPRVFDEVQALYGENMTALSGGLVYEYTQEEADYGLVVINDNDTISLRTDFDNLQTQFNKLDISLIQSQNETGTSIEAPECKKSLIDDDTFGANWTIPSTPTKAANWIKNGLDNPNQGKIVDVTATTVPVAIYGTDGSEISELKITKVADGESNVPSGSMLSSGTKTTGNNSTSTSSGSSSSSTQQGAAGKVGVKSTGALVFAAVLAIMLC